MKSILTMLTFGLLFACQSNQVHEQAEKPAAVTQQENWKLITDESNFSFITTKNKTITEQHSIDFSFGSISKDNQLTLELDLSSVDTGIEIRDQRLKELLFEIDSYPNALITANLPDQLILFEPNEIEFELNLHGFSQKLTASVVIQSVGEQLVVTNFLPVQVTGKDFGLDAAINQLTKIAGLQSINYDVEVDFKLTFEIQ